jgi:hypothetical protein
MADAGSHRADYSKNPFEFIEEAAYLMVYTNRL